jgi:Flp pilus assembly protein TadG
MNFRKIFENSWNESGQILTELVIAAPIIMLVIVAIVSLGQAEEKQALVTRAAAAAARVAVVRSDLAAGAAFDMMRAADPSIQPGDVRTTVKAFGVTASPFSRTAKVRVSYKYRPISGFGWHPVFRLEAEYVVDQYDNAVWFNIPPP